MMTVGTRPHYGDEARKASKTLAMMIPAKKPTWGGMVLPSRGGARKSLEVLKVLLLVPSGKGKKEQRIRAAAATAPSCYGLRPLTSTHPRACSWHAVDNSTAFEFDDCARQIYNSTNMTGTPGETWWGSDSDCCCAGG